LSESSRAIDSPDTLDSLLNFLKQADSPVSGIMELRGILVPTLFNFFTSSLTPKQKTSVFFTGKPFRSGLWVRSGACHRAERLKGAHSGRLEPC
jgi:hypothetical protein